jgi:hypothetical protein
METLEFSVGTYEKRGEGLEIYALKNIFDWPRQNHYNINITLISSKEKKWKKKTYFPESKKI